MIQENRKCRLCREREREREERERERGERDEIVDSIINESSK